MSGEKTMFLNRSSIRKWLFLILITGLAYAAWRSGEMFRTVNHTAVDAVTFSPDAEPDFHKPGESILETFAPVGFAPAGDLEAFAGNSLRRREGSRTDRILMPDFRRLTCRRFSPSPDPSTSLEVCLFDMSSIESATVIYYQLKPPDATNIDLTRVACQAADDLRMVVPDRYYVEIRSAGPSTAGVHDLAAMGRLFVEHADAIRMKPIVEGKIPFPVEGLLTNSLALETYGVFGFDGFAQAHIARYRIDGTELTAFVSTLNSEAEARALVGDYRQFLLRNGGTRLDTEIPIPEASVIEILGSYELIFTRGIRVCGVHMADRLAPARKLAITLSEGRPDDG